MQRLILLVIAASLLGACSPSGEPGGTAGPNAVADETAQQFIDRVNTEYKDWWRELNAAGWLRATYINEDSGVVDALANERYAAWHTAKVREAMRYDGQDVDPATRRALELLKDGALMVAPDDDAKRKELSGILTELQGMYGAGKYCRNDNECFGGSELEGLMQQSRDYDELLEYWAGWREIAKPMRAKYERFVELSNEGAREFGSADLGELWRKKYDMSAEQFEGETARLWEQVKPLYDELHCHVRAKLGEHYGTDKVPPDGPIPAHLLGNMWAQEWGFIYDLMEPYPGVSDLDVDATLKAKNYSPQEMVRSAEDFYVSLGMQRLPDTFWERSQFSKPADRDVVCHASAWNLDGEDDLRIKMCIKQTYDELRVIYHELGHNYYQRAYNKQPMLFRDGANGGFHEAIGDAVTLSMTPEYLAEVGLVASAQQSQQAIINRQMQQALDKIAFLPFGKLIDEWRWGVFSGDIKPENYNQAWWDLRLKYQGIAPPIERSEADFDPGSKYHVPGNVSYTRYFLARILQFQFQRALCETAGFEGPLNECSIYGSKEAGAKLTAMLETGASVPWQDTLEKLTGTREMDASAIIEYFAPLMVYLKEQNAGRSCGW
ncbi:MAG: M2 family metallopeptidase [Gammaproteobacteria bacterium]|nr:M2 family metallopeptidase [Gammaproteobacteria bacterium]MDH5304814.1 M2 family metallopeptidase [Gammaproteobacteria bacterium]MDH5323535.1 M2 family metallopeptidase [Gammaproteobacteria bacterium]